MSATDWGTTFETFAGGALGLEDVSHDGGDMRLADGLATSEIDPSMIYGEATRERYRHVPKVSEGSRVGIKVCRYRISAGDSTRRGRWFLPAEELARVEAVVFGIYTEDLGVVPESFAVLPTSRVEAAVGAWSDSAHESYTSVTRPSWALVFDPAVVDRVIEERRA